MTPRVEHILVRIRESFSPVASLPESDRSLLYPSAKTMRAMRNVVIPNELITRKGSHRCVDVLGFLDWWEQQLREYHDESKPTHSGREG